MIIDHNILLLLLYAIRYIVIELIIYYKNIKYN